MDDEKLKDIALNFQANISDKLLKENMELKKEIQALQTKLKESPENFNKDSTQESILNTDLISKQAVLSEIETVCFSKAWSKFRADNGSNGTRDYIINYIKQLPSSQPEPCKDVISRQAAKDAICKEWCGCDVKHCPHSSDETYYCDGCDDARIIDKLPSVTPQKVVRCKDCKYVWKEDGYDNLWCNRLTGSFSVDRDGYCAWAKMEEGENKE